MTLRTCSLLLLVACAGRSPAPGAAPAMDRVDFNAQAAMLAVPLFWIEDADADGRPDAEELAVLHGIDDSRWSDWIDGGLTPRAREAIVRIGQPHPIPEGDPAEARRRAAVRAELAQGRPSLVATDLSDLPAAEQAAIEHLVHAAEGIERLFALQKGVNGLEARIGADDPESRALLRRNQGPWCEAPETESDPDCRALAEPVSRLPGVYPAGMDVDTVCSVLEAHPDAGRLLDPFTAVREVDGVLEAVPYPQAFPEAMEAVAVDLDAAAAALGEAEPALVAYLHAASAAFRTGNWYAADEAWDAMDARNSRWYLRVGPDETYWDPCNRKAGFHLVLARIDPSSLAWQDRLDPHKAAMEGAVAEKAGPPYTAREVAFDLPDFIRIVLNAGDARQPTGATIGQSLPNWGPVAEAGGRTVAMTNLNNDPDSVRIRTDLARSVLCTDTMARLSPSPEPLLMSTVLHEAAHNLGPAAGYTVDGRTDEEGFGGPLAALEEELKAQTAAFFLGDQLASLGAVTVEERDAAHLADIVWAFGQLGNGLTTGDGHIKPYPQLSAIQLGWFLEHGGIAFHPDMLAANGVDTGCLEVDPEGLVTSVQGLAAEVFGAKSRLDRDAAEALRVRYVEAPGPHADVRELVVERWRRAPLTTMVYSLRR